MDSAWSDKALELDHNHGINNGKMVDLTLKLGQPVSDDDCRPGYQGNEGISRGKSCIAENKQKRTNTHFGNNGHGPPNLLSDNNRTHSVGYSNNMVSTEFVVGIPPSQHYSNYHFNGGFSHIPAAGGSLFPSHKQNFTYNCYKISKGEAALPPSPPRNVDNGTNSLKHGIDIGKRCMNSECNTNDTPMWRKGPLGAKTLCNACGIRYRKEEDRRKAREAAMYEIISRCRFNS